MFKFLFGPRTPDALAVADWLLNMRDSFLEEWAELERKDTSSAKDLALFSLTMSCHSASNILHIDTGSIKNISRIFIECRGYYDCLWQLYLLMNVKGDEDIEKIQNLYAIVDCVFNLKLSNIFKENKKIEGLFANAITDEYHNHLGEFVTIYIHKAFEAENWIGHVTNQMALRMTKYVPSVDAWAKVPEVIGNDTIHALSMKMLTDFNLKQCKIATGPR